MGFLMGFLEVMMGWQDVGDWWCGGGEMLVNSVQMKVVMY